MPACNDRVRDILTGWGFSVVVVAVSDFIKTGGAVRCLTMPLDIGAADAAKQPGNYQLETSTPRQNAT